MVLMSGALSSGAVNPSWIWNLLTAVFTVNLLLVSGLRGRMGSPGGEIRFTEPLRGLYFTLSRLLTWSKLYRDLGPLSTRLKRALPTRNTPLCTWAVHSP